MVGDLKSDLWITLDKILLKAFLLFALLHILKLKESNLFMLMFLHPAHRLKRKYKPKVVLKRAHREELAKMEKMEFSDWDLVMDCNSLSVFSQPFLNKLSEFRQNIILCICTRDFNTLKISVISARYPKVSWASRFSLFMNHIYAWDVESPLCCWTSLVKESNEAGSKKKKKKNQEHGDFTAFIYRENKIDSLKYIQNIQLKTVVSSERAKGTQDGFLWYILKTRDWAGRLHITVQLGKLPAGMTV